MMQVINRLRGRDQVQAERPRMISRYVYQPEPPMGFVRRSDPNFYYLQRR